MAADRRIGVLGLGNVLMGDDALGPYVIGLLSARYRFEEGVSAFRSSLRMHNNGTMRACEHVWGSDRVRLASGPTETLTGSSLFWRI